MLWWWWYFSFVCATYVLFTTSMTFAEEFSESVESLLSPYSLPTEEEVSRAFVLKPAKGYGAHVRKDKQVRVAFLGGSQTDKYYYVDIFRNMFQPIHKKWTSLELIVVNDGIGGGYPGIRVYDFEKLPLAQWPNVLVFEYGLNCGNDDDDVLSHVGNFDSMIDFILRKYSDANLPAPSMLFIEFFRIGYYFYNEAVDRGRPYPYTLPNFNFTEFSSPLQFNNLSMIASKELERPYNRGSHAGTLILELARFHRIPFISFKDAIFPSFTRFHMSHRIDTFWPFTREGSHTSNVGCEYIVKHLLLPFFTKLIQPHPKDENQLEEEHALSIASKQARMFPFDFYPSTHIYGSWTIWIRAFAKEVLPVWYPPSPGWTIHFLRGHNDRHHDCYGSNSTSDKGILRFSHYSNSHLLGKYTLHLHVGYLQSHDTSYIANAVCDVFVHPDVSKKEFLGSMHFRAGVCNGVNVTSSGPCHERFVLTKTGNYTMECQNQEETKLACVTYIALISEREPDEVVEDELLVVE